MFVKLHTMLVVKCKYCSFFDFGIVFVIGTRPTYHPNKLHNHGKSWFWISKSSISAQFVRSSSYVSLANDNLAIRTSCRRWSAVAAAVAKPARRSLSTTVARKGQLDGTVPLGLRGRTSHDLLEKKSYQLSIDKLIPNWSKKPEKSRRKPTRLGGLSATPRDIKRWLSISSNKQLIKHHHFSPISTNHFSYYSLLAKSSNIFKHHSISIHF